MDTTTLDPVVEAPSHDEAARLVNAQQPAPVETPAGPASSAATASADKPRRKGGFPKGAKRGPDGKKVAGDGPVASAPKPAPAGKVYTPEMARGAAPLSGEVKDGPLPAGVPSAPDPALVAYLRPYLSMGIKGITMLLAFVTRRPAAVATDDEREMMAEAWSLKLAADLPQFAAQASTTAVGAATLPYLVRLLEQYFPEGMRAGPSAEAPRPTPTAPVIESAAAAPAETPPPPPAVDTPSDSVGYGTIPL